MTAAAPGKAAAGAGEKLATLLVLEGKARAAEATAEIGFLLVNDTATLVPFRNGVLWRGERVAAVSGLPQPVREAPFTAFSTRLCRALAKEGGGARKVDRAALPGAATKDWDDFLPAHALWLPLSPRPAEGGLLLARDTPWADPELRIAALWVEAGGHALAALEARGRFRLPGLAGGRRGLIKALALLPLLALLVPVRLSVLAQAEVVPTAPLPVRAPLAGVVEDVPVKPNAPVKAGDLLLRLDSRELEGRREVARQQLEVTQAEYRLAQQSGIVDQRAQIQAAVLATHIEERRAELALVDELLSRVTVTAEHDGIALIPDPASLRGKPVRVGERLLTIADPAQVEVEMWVSVADAVVLEPGAPVRLFLNVAPDHDVPAILRFVNYQATVSPAGVLAFRAAADFADGPPPRIGLRGTARIEGERVTLFYYLFRRPLSSLRQVLGV